MEYDDAVAWTKEHPNWLDELARRSSFSVPLPARDSDLFLTAEPPSLLPSPSPSSAGPLLLPPQPYTAQTDSNSDFDPDLEEAIRLSKLEQQQYFTPEDPQVACAESVDSPASMEAEATEVEVEVKMPNSTAPQALQQPAPSTSLLQMVSVDDVHGVHTTLKSSQKEDKQREIPQVGEFPLLFYLSDLRS
jgi:hypothetical protein